MQLNLKKSVYYNKTWRESFKGMFFKLFSRPKTGSNWTEPLI
jgi:hypothetical protein